VILTSVNGTTKGKDITVERVGSEKPDSGKKTYTVGVTSWGPDRLVNESTYDDITTWPDEIEL